MARPILLRFGFSFVVSTASGEFLLLFFCVTSICTRSFPGGLKEIEKVLKGSVLLNLALPGFSITD